MRKGLSFFRELWRRESLTTRGLLVLGVVLVALAVLSAILIVVVGVLAGDWHWGELVDNVSSLVLVFLGFGYVYWRRRAMDAEKSAVTRDHSVHFNVPPIRLSDIERWRERQSKALDL
ncbi:hypothetical protein ACIBQ0_17130 [Nocardia nova]|uniref:hypothetical protein n=1 Tax=Nocardia nova TaxID=37330 RepID=UPI0037A68188